MSNAFLHRGKREKLVQRLSEKGITDKRVLDAIAAIPRHAFVDSALRHEAYEDKALPIAADQTISQPFTVAYMTQMLALKKGMKILEVGTGSGYQAAVLCEMGMRVFSIERNATLHTQAKKRLENLDFRPFLHLGDGSAGWKRYAPFERIIVTAASPRIPSVLQNQLDVGGKLILPVGSLSQQVMTVVTRTSQQTFEVQRLSNFQFVPLIGRHGWAEEETR